MKKFGTVLVFVLLAVLIVGFNYLIWDRDSKVKEIESLRDLTADRNISLRERLDEIRKLEEELDSLQVALNRLQNENENLQEDLKNARLEEFNMNKLLSNRNDIINILKKYADTDLFASPVNEWISLMSAGDYEKAYEIQFASGINDEEQLKRDEYIKDLKAGIESITLTHISLDDTRGADEGYVYLIGDLNIVASSEPALTSAGYKNGINKLSFRIDYDSRTEKFVIGEIAPITQ
jgi:hypothetical protein